jgi:hypothetical protein
MKFSCNLTTWWGGVAKQIGILVKYVCIKSWYINPKIKLQF